MRKGGYIFLFALGLLWGCITHAAQVYEINDQCQVTVHEILKAKTPSNKELPRHGWVKAELPDRWKEDPAWQGYQGGAWYKLDWSWKCKNNARLAEPIAFNIEYLINAGTVYLNGDLLWTDKNLQEPLSKSWNVARYWILPISGIKQQHNETLIYVSGYTSMNGGVGPIGFNNIMSNVEHHNELTWHRRTILQLNVFLSGTLGIICFVIWIMRRSDTSFGWFALASVLWILFISNALTTETFPYPDSIFSAKANLIFWMLFSQCFCIYMLRFIRQKFPRLELAFTTLTAVLIAVVMLMPFEKNADISSVIFLLYCLFYFITYIYLCYRSFKTKRRDSIFLSLCLTAMLIFGVVDLAIMMYFPKEGIMPVSPYTSPIITLFIVVILGARLNRNIQKIEQFNDELAFEVKKVSDELFSSLSDKHQLELSNVRLQERIKLSHDLHDGLGASIVRSMILVDQCEKDIPNTQFLSMLKLLRDDLRQIIDSGSSLDSKVPDSPLLWIAPVRHRFSQLMEEMEMISKWNFPAAWKERPSSLQCLTLIRVVEESLTNIVKHSKATTVKVTMTHKENEPLILIIEDDGIGFDVESVSTHGMSVGMRSMKMRIQRIGGKLNIISQAGSTIIQAEIQIKSAA